MKLPIKIMNVSIYNNQLYANKLNNLHKIDRFLDGCMLTRLKIQDDIINLNRPITNKEVELIINRKHSSNKKSNI